MFGHPNIFFLFSGGFFLAQLESGFSRPEEFFKTCVFGELLLLCRLIERKPCLFAWDSFDKFFFFFSFSCHRCNWHNFCWGISILFFVFVFAKHLLVLLHILVETDRGLFGAQ